MKFPLWAKLSSVAVLAVLTGCLTGQPQATSPSSTPAASAESTASVTSVESSSSTAVAPDSSATVAPFRQFKGLIGILLTNLLLFVSVLTITPAPAKAGNFNFDGSVIEINQKFEGAGDRNSKDIDDIDVLITVIVGATAIIIGSAYFVWFSVSQIPNMIKRELPVKNSESDNTVPARTLTEIHS